MLGKGRPTKNIHINLEGDKHSVTYKADQSDFFAGG